MGLSMAKAVRVPQPADIKNWPDDPKMKVFVSNGTLYGGYRLRKRDPQTHRQHEQKVYSGRIVDGTYYPMEEFREKFTRTGELRDKVAAEAQVKAAGLPAEVAERVMKRDAERQALMSSIADVLGDFGGNLTAEPAPVPVQKKSTVKKVARKASPEEEDVFAAGPEDSLADIAGVTVSEVKSTGVGATLVGLPGEGCRASVLELGAAGRLWNAEAVKATGFLRGSVYFVREADAAAAVTRLWDKQDSGVVMTVPGDDKTRLSPKDLLSGTTKYAPGQAGAGLGLLMGQQSASRRAGAATVAVFVTGTAQAKTDVVNGRAVMLVVTDAVMTPAVLQTVALAAASGFAQAGFLTEGLTVLAAATGGVKPEPLSVAAAAAEAARAAGQKARRR